MSAAMPSADAGPSKPPSLLPFARLPPLQGMQQLDKSRFDVQIPCLAVRVEAAKISKVRERLLAMNLLVDLPRVHIIRQDPDDAGLRIMRLRVRSEGELSQEAKEYLASETRGIIPDTIELDYDYWTSSDVLNSILPPHEDELAPSSFTITGHIGHVNLRDEWLPYKHLIGQVFLDKNAMLRTVVNKLNTIHAEYRYFDMEVLAGEPDFITTLSEQSCTFTFDFRTVYWNSRLHTEHARLCAQLRPGEIIADVMAGVGPFAIPAAKRGCGVLANDLNPDGVKWMRENAVANRVADRLRASNIDGQAFIRQAPSLAWTDPFPIYTAPLASRRKAEQAARRARNAQPPPATSSSSSSSAPLPPTSAPTPPAIPEAEPQPALVSHYIMNLPDSALTFLPAFVGLFRPMEGVQGFREKVEQEGMPMVHVYCFTRFLDPAEAERDICERASHYLSHLITPHTPDFHLHLVRSVAPNKEMYCLSFRLPQEVAYADPETAVNGK